MERLNKCYDPDKTLDFTEGRRAITPLNKHRWDMTLHAGLSFGKEHNQKVSIFLSAHSWKTRHPTDDEIEATMQMGDDGQLPIPGMFIYAEGMPVIVNQNKYLGLKVVNGSEFTAVGIIPDPTVQEHVVDDGVSIFLGPPSGILLQSSSTKDLAFPHIPPDTILLAAESIPLQKDKHGKLVCPELVGKPGFNMGLSRRGLPCVPGFVITDYKSQSRTMEKVLLGLYGRKATAGDVDRCEILSLYVQLSRCKSLSNTRLLRPLRPKDFLDLRMDPELIQGIQKLRVKEEQSIRGFEKRQLGRQPLTN
jgi:hypothetical protein